MDNWTNSSRALPAEHEPVRFVVSGHKRAMVGIYEQHCFCARWGTYTDAQVRIWHRLGDAQRAPAPQRARA